MDKRKHNIERYLRGEMTPSEMHALEKEALEDPFLSEALEGFQNASPETYLFDLRQLHQSVHQRTKARKPKIISMWNWSLGIAAGLIFIAASAVFIISSLVQERKDALATAEKTEEATPKPGAVTPADSTLLSGDDATEIPAEQEPARNEAVQSTARQEDPGAIAENNLEQETDDEHTRIARAPDTTAIQSLNPRPEVDNLPAERETSPTTSAEGAAKSLLSSDTTHLVKGRVTSADDKTPLPGVNVTVKGTEIETETDINGYFKLNVPDIRQSLTFNFIGMEQVEITPHDRSDVNVELNPDLSQLSEVVVIGYDDDDKRLRRELAEPAVGKDAFKDYLEKSLKYPEHALKNGVEGRVTIEFTVGTDGHLAGFLVLKGLGYGCDDEAIRLVKEGPAWKPSRRNAQAVTERVKLRLKFSIPKKK